MEKKNQIPQKLGSLRRRETVEGVFYALFLGEFSALWDERHCQQQGRCLWNSSRHI